MKNYNHKLWLSFLQRAATLPLEYSLDELKWLKEISDEQFPSISPLIAGCIVLAKGEMPRQAGRHATGDRMPTLRSKPVKSSPFISVFEDGKRFPKNSDLIAYARKRFPNMRGYRFDKMSRRRIAQTIASFIHTSSPDILKMAEMELLESQVLGDSRHNKASFLSTWEDTIKNS